MTYRILWLVLALAVTGGCGTSANDKTDATKTTSEDSAAQQNPQRPLSIKKGKFFEIDGRKFLYGGEREEQHFDITGYALKDEQFHYGIGREAFPALLDPDFITVDMADEHFKDNDRFLLLRIDSLTKAYSIQDLTRHEVVNDVVNGKPVMAAYCILADLGAIYERTLGDKTFTFALSGYTYFDPGVWDGMDGFILWDRETESLWWPLTGKAVSGPMQGASMKVLDETLWSQTNWQFIKENYPDTKVLTPGQDFERPLSWPSYTDITGTLEEGDGVAPRWGENDQLGQNKQ